MSVAAITSGRRLIKRHHLSPMTSARPIRTSRSRVHHGLAVRSRMITWPLAGLRCSWHAPSSASVHVIVRDGTLGPAREMAEASARLQTLAAGRDMAVSATVSITASVVVSHFLLPSIAAQLRAAEPAMEGEHVPSDTTENLIDREADIAIRMFWPAKLDIVTHEIGDGRSAVARRGPRRVRRAGAPSVRRGRPVGHDPAAGAGPGSRRRHRGLRPATRRSGRGQDARLRRLRRGRPADGDRGHRAEGSKARCPAGAGSPPAPAGRP